MEKIQLNCITSNCAIILKTACVDKFGIVPFPSTVVNRHPRIIYTKLREEYTASVGPQMMANRISVAVLAVNVSIQTVLISATQLLKKWM